MTDLPRPLADYPVVPGQSLLDTLAARLDIEPFNGVATAIFVLAITHTFAAPQFAQLAHRVQHRSDDRARAAGHAPRPDVMAELLHFLGEVEVVFGLWALVLTAALAIYAGWDVAKHYINDGVNFTEPMFVVVVMALASTRPVVTFAEAALRRVAAAGGRTPGAWWISILTIGPVLGSFITEPAAMTICALLLARQFFALQPSRSLRYATLGLLFVNISIGGTLTHFAAPPVLMVARVWGWDTAFMFGHFGWRAVVAVIGSTATYYLVFRREFTAMAARTPVQDVDVPEEPHGTALLPIPVWVTLVHLAFLLWSVVNAHYPALFIGGFLFFIGFARATDAYQSRLDLKTPLLVGFFLGGLVIHGGVQGWWIAPVLSSLGELPLFVSSALLTAFNDNALITYLSTLAPTLGPELKIAVVGGAVAGGGLTVIANAPNPAGQALLGRFFGGAVSPLGLLLGALWPTLLAAAAFRLL